MAVFLAELFPPLVQNTGTPKIMLCPAHTPASAPAPSARCPAAAAPTLPPQFSGSDACGTGRSRAASTQGSHTSSVLLSADSRRSALRL